MLYMREFTPDAEIVVFCIFIGVALKFIGKRNDQIIASIPWILGVAGGLIAYIGALATPNEEGIEMYNIIAQGVVSGLAACGCYQVVHQQKKLRDETAGENVLEVMEERITNEVNSLSGPLGDIQNILEKSAPIIDKLLDFDGERRDQKKKD